MIMEDNGLQISDITIVFRYILPVLKIYNIRDVNCKSSYIGHKYWNAAFLWHCDVIVEKEKRYLTCKIHTYVWTNLLSSIYIERSIRQDMILHIAKRIRSTFFTMSRSTINQKFSANASSSIKCNRLEGKVAIVTASTEG